MTAIRTSSLASLVLAVACLATVDADAQARSGGSSGGSRGGSYSGGHSGGHSGAWNGTRSGWHGGSSHGYYGGGHYRYGYWPYGLGLGLAIAAPWYWGGYYSPYYYGYYGAPYYPATYSVAPYGAYADGSVPYEYSTPPEPTTDLGPVSEPGTPMERPLYLNYCASAKAYFPKVRTCAEGWQMKRPTYQ
jgi:hypothetical protein